MDKRIFNIILAIMIATWLYYGYNLYIKPKPLNNLPVSNTVVSTNYERTANYYISLARKEFHKKNYYKAIDFLNQALETNPSNPDLIYYYIGMCYFDLHQYEESIKSYDKAIELNPSDSSFYYMKALSYIDLKNYNEFKSNLEKAIKIEQDKGNTYEAGKYREFLDRTVPF